MIVINITLIISLCQLLSLSFSMCFKKFPKTMFNICYYSLSLSVTKCNSRFQRTREERWRVCGYRGGFLSVLRDRYDFLRIFQSKDIKIHLLIEAFYSHLKNVLVDICEPAGLRKSKGCPLGGLELKVLVLETTVER